MTVQRNHYETTINVDAQALYDWHSRTGAFERLIPPWENVELESPNKRWADDEIMTLLLKMGFIQLPWIAQLKNIQPGQSFSDKQLSGPFASWLHHHRFHSNADNTARLEDEIHWTLPLAPISHWVAGWWIAQQLDRMFNYRHKQTQFDLSLWERYSKGQPSMKIAVTGTTGLVGSQLCAFLTAQGHQVVRLVRQMGLATKDDIFWDPDAGTLPPNALNGVDAVIHLAGDNIASGRWSAAKKERIRDSRVKGTQLLAQSLAALADKPKVLVCASATGFYGDTGNTTVDETAPAGQGFLSDVCKVWEESTQPAAQAGIRVVNARLGIVMSPKGGALAKMLPPFLMGGGGPLGSGQQLMSWIALDDVIGALYHCVMTDSLAGPVNLVVPKPITNKDFSSTLGKVLFRPAFLPAPAFAIRLLLGEMADALLLSSCGVKPTKLEQSGYPFRFTELEPALRVMLGKA